MSIACRPQTPLAYETGVNTMRCMVANFPTCPQVTQSFQNRLPYQTGFRNDAWDISKF